LLPQGEETCVVECKSTTECPPAWTCDAEGVLSHNGRPGGAVHYCRSATHGKLSDGGAPAHDASHSTAAQSDAGAPKKIEQHDAGTKVK
jgi:hypothetical protein